jgi:hypothetical protein
MTPQLNVAFRCFATKPGIVRHYESCGILLQLISIFQLKECDLALWQDGMLPQ